MTDSGRCLCGSKELQQVFTYHAPPKGEIPLTLPPDRTYERELVRCAMCGHFLSFHQLYADDLYKGLYVDATYGNGMGTAFERIISLDPAASDNVGRVSRIIDFADEWFGRSAGAQPRSVLDVGSGLCVFLHRMRGAGWTCTAIDPDPRAVAHARDRVGVDAICGEFGDVDDIGRFDVVTFNKVVEHVRDPAAMVRTAARHLNPGGFVYVEVPDGEMAILDGPDREEFFVDHWHVFSASSLALLAAHAGFSLVALERLREPSGKYTLRSFLALADVPQGRAS